MLQGCSTKQTVHVYAKYLTDEQAKSVSTALADDNVIVKVNRLAFPASVFDNTLIYSPGKNTRNIAGEVMEKVKLQGFQIDATGLILASNHSFSANNMGVYLVPDNVNLMKQRASVGKYDIPLLNEYTARDCQHASTLTLKSDATFTIEEDVWQKSTEHYSQNLFQGTWKIAEEKFLMLSSPSFTNELYYERRTFSRSIPEGEIKGYQLIPMTSYLATSEQGRVYCTYEISQVFD